MIDLNPSAIHLRLVFYNQIDDERLNFAYREIMSDAERKQESKFHFAEDCRRYRVTRALVRLVLSQYARVSPEKWVFATDAYGRPTIANPEASKSHLSFNISHTKGLIILAVAKRRALGVDVEDLSACVSVDAAYQYFSATEVAELALADRKEQKFRFYEYWTFKESYIKARGMGLSLPLDKFSFSYPHSRGVEIVIHPDLADDPARWQFWQFRPSSNYLLAVCAERMKREAITLVVSKVIPMMTDEIIAPSFLRTSH
jgi:4'-phosphopantetheinyl transferase